MASTDLGLTVIVGAGALGAMYARRIHESGLDVAFFAEGERKDRIAGTGLTVNGTLLRIPLLDRSELVGPKRPERIIVALKDQHLSEFGGVLAGFVSPETTVISVMNGIDSEPVLAHALGESLTDDTGRVLYCMVAGMDAVRDGNDVNYTRLGTVFFGRRRNDPERPDPRVAGMAAFLEAAGIPFKIPADMEKAVWNKFMLNVGINQWSALLGAPYGVFHRGTEAQDLMRRAMAEVLAIARTRSIDLTEDDMEQWFSVVNTLSPEGKTSMLQDIEARRKTEVEMFAGRVVEMGREAGIPTPVNEVLLEAIHTLESMYL
jgi:2-dehydropantoate 2-reductase